MKFQELLDEKNDKNEKSKTPRKNVRVIPTNEAMRKFEEIYKRHKKVFDYLKDK